MRKLLLAAFLSLGVGCQQASETPQPPTAPRAEPGPTPVSRPVDKVQAEPGAGEADLRVGRDATPECLPIFKQTGPGCDQAGIETTLKTLRRPGGPVGRCYRSGLDQPKEGLIRFRITLKADGQVGEVETLVDEFEGTPLAACLNSAVRSLKFPAPGDVPCIVVHTFPFVSEVKSK